MLTYEIALPEAPRDGAPLIVLLHGRGSDEHDLKGLRPAFPAEAILVTPRAPFSGTAWGYGPGWAWYRFLGEATPEPESFEAAQADLETFLRELPGELPVRPGPLILGGFSQGGTMSLGYALRHPGEAAGVMIFSGFLPIHPSVTVDDRTISGTRVFWGHGTLDDLIPFANGVAGRATLRGAGADLTTIDVPIGHGISPDELRAAGRWLDETLTQAGSAAATLQAAR